jgi:hypothetical protein
MKHLVIAALAVAAPAAAFAQDTLIAGWTFSQFLGAGLPSIDGENFTNTPSVVATYRGSAVPNFSAVSGVYNGDNSLPGYSDPAFGTWSWNNFSIDTAGEVNVFSFGASYNTNSITPDGLNMGSSDSRGIQLEFLKKNTEWSITVPGVTGYTNATGSDFTYSAFGVGGAATVEWLINGTPFVSQAIGAGSYATFSHDLPAAFYTGGQLTGRVTAGSAGGVRFDNVQIAGVASAIPEPSAFAAIAGLVGLVAVSVRRRKSA